MNSVALLQVTEAASSALAGVVQCERRALPYGVSSSRRVSVAVSSRCCCDPLSTLTAALRRTQEAWGSGEGEVAAVQAPLQHAPPCRRRSLPNYLSWEVMIACHDPRWRVRIMPVSQGRQGAFNPQRQLLVMPAGAQQPHPISLPKSRAAETTSRECKISEEIKAFSFYTRISLPMFSP